jgi:hypothetical protein
MKPLGEGTGGRLSDQAGASVAAIKTAPQQASCTNLFTEWPFQGTKLIGYVGGCYLMQLAVPGSDDASNELAGSDTLNFLDGVG